MALDHVEWEIVDAKRVQEKLPPVGAAGKLAIDPLGREGFDVRQPQHIPWPAPWAWATSTSRRPVAGGTRCSTSSV